MHFGCSLSIGDPAEGRTGLAEGRARAAGVSSWRGEVPGVASAQVTGAGVRLAEALVCLAGVVLLLLLLRARRRGKDRDGVLLGSGGKARRRGRAAAALLALPRLAMTAALGIGRGAARLLRRADAAASAAVAVAGASDAPSGTCGRNASATTLSSITSVASATNLEALQAAASKLLGVDKAVDRAAAADAGAGLEAGATAPLPLARTMSSPKESGALLELPDPACGRFPSVSAPHHRPIVRRQCVADWLVRCCPARCGASQWRLLYASTRDGTSLRTLYRKCHEVSGPCLLLVRDTVGAAFGCFTSDAWHQSQRGRHYGTGECFVFSLGAAQAAADVSDERAMAGAAVFRWTKSNSHFQAGSGEFIAIGGGSHFALWLDEELHFGSSGPCETFGSPCLAGREEFIIERVEVWSCGDL